MSRDSRDKIKQLWDYQEEAVCAFLPDDIDKGRLDLPTAAGKGVIGRELAFRLAEKKESPFVAVIFTPRLVLNKQWGKACNDHFHGNRKSKRNWSPIFVGSDPAGKIGNEYEKSHSKAGVQGTIPSLSTTNPNELRKRVNFLVRSNYNIIIISTYHSNKCVRQSGINIDFCFYDEAHFLPTGKSELLACDYDDDFFAATDLNASKKVFTTATPRRTASSKGRGMNNESIYGPIVFRRSPKEMIETGAIVPPVLHAVGTDSRIIDIFDNDNIEFPDIKSNIGSRDFNSQTNLIFDVFSELGKSLRTRSAYPEKISPKMLTVCNGQGNLEGILGPQESQLPKPFQNKNLMKSHPRLKMAALCVDWGIGWGDVSDWVSYKNVTNQRKEEFLQWLWNLKYTDEVIIFHVDMIGVGLDVPMLNGVLMMRNCNLIKFQQNIGRAARLHPFDRERIESGELQIGDMAHYVKPKYEVILPYCFDGKEDFFEQKKDWLISLRDDYNFDPSELVTSENSQPAPTDDPDDSLPPSMRGTIAKEMLQFFHAIEESEILVQANKDADEIIKALENGGKV